MGTSDNSCDRNKPKYYNHVWSYDFVNERLENGRKVRMLVVIDEFTRECFALDTAKHFKGKDVVEVLRYLFAVRGCPKYLRSYNGPEFVSKTVRKWLDVSGVDTLYVAPGSPWENGYVESFNSKLRDELFNRELFLHIDELRYVANRWRMDYNIIIDRTAASIIWLRQHLRRYVLSKAPPCSIQREYVRYALITTGAKIGAD